MQRFADFADDPGILDGAKVRIDDVLNRELVITGYAVKTSKFSKNKSGKYLTLQFRLDDDKRVLFTGSDVLIDQMEKYGDRVFCVRLPLEEADKLNVLTSPTFLVDWRSDETETVIEVTEDGEQEVEQQLPWPEYEVAVTDDQGNPTGTRMQGCGRIA